MIRMGMAVFLLLLATPALSVEPTADALDDALAIADLTRADVGWEARGWWQRYPQDIEYKLRHFDDLCAEPLAIPRFLRAMGETVRQTLAPEKISGEENGQDAGALFVAVHNLGVNKRYGATRAYSANLTAEPTPLADALLQAWRSAGRQTQFVTFGQESPYPQIKRDLDAACADLPELVSGVLGKLVLDLLDAVRWADLAFRNVPLEERVRIASRLDLGAEETDALEYEPALDDAAHAWDEASLWYAGLKAVEACDLARLALQEPVEASRGKLSELRIEIDTPLGRVIVDGTEGHDIEAGDSTFLIVDLGGDDTYSGAVGASTPTRPIGVALDLAGDDSYDGGDRSLGAGVTGIGVLVDAEGIDSYSGGTISQGVGHLGMGVLIDIEGDDDYAAHYSAQGAGFFGIGLLIDLAGEDQYTIWSDGQGFGGVAGVGLLADRVGDDSYLAVVDPAITGRPSYHTELKVAVSNAQGCAMGRRGDGADGHSWAGGLGALLDAEGNDTYQAGNWAQGCGYWFGTGLVWDGGGDDQYRANGWASASGAHFCIGAVVDEAGNDLHEVAQNWGPAFGHDFTAAILLDVTGDDRYNCGGDGIGYSINRSVVLCLDGGGDDLYQFETPERYPGIARFDPRFADLAATSVYWREPTSIGLFLDVGGTDLYPDSVANDSAKTDAPESENVVVSNRSIFVDRAAGAIDLVRSQRRPRR